MKNKTSYQYNINYDTNKYIDELRDKSATNDYALRAIGILLAATAIFAYLLNYWTCSW